MKLIKKLIKKILFAFLLLYTYNIISTSFNLNIPINTYTISTLTVLDFPGLFLLAIILKLYY